jgi:hypothetical protein
MANKEWLITKIVGTCLGIITLVSICIGGANVVVQLRNDVSRNRIDFLEHREDNAAKFSDIYDDVEANEDKIHAIELQNTRIEQNQIEILRRIDENREYYEKLHGEVMNFMRNFEVVE